MVWYKIIYTESAKSDLRGIYGYIAEQALRPITASKQMKLIKDMVANLSFMPQKCPFVDRACYLYRKRNVKKKYIIVYMIDESQKIVFINRIFNAKQNWRSLLR